MPVHCLEVGVIVARRKLGSVWADHVWLPHAVLSAVPAAAPGTFLGSADGSEYFYAGPAELSFDTASTAYYRDNLTSAQPSIWISLRSNGTDSYEIPAVTADPYRGEALTECIGETVEAVPMPHDIQASLWAFIEAFHVERPFFKRKRDNGGRPGRHSPVQPAGDD